MFKTFNEKQQLDEEARKTLESNLKDLTAKVGAMKLELIEVSSRRDRSPTKILRKNTTVSRKNH